MSKTAQIKEMLSMLNSLGGPLWADKEISNFVGVALPTVYKVRYEMKKASPQFTSNEIKDASEANWLSYLDQAVEAGVAVAN